MRKDVKYLICPKCAEPRMRLGSKTKKGKQRYYCYTGCGHTTIYPKAPYKRPGEVEPEANFEQPIKKQTLVITWAQNATPIHSGFFNSLRAYCERNKAQLIVVAGRYKNPTSTWDASQRNEQWWKPELVPYLLNKRIRINKNLVLVGDVKTQPTAVTPLSGFEGLTHGESSIFGHPKLQMVVVPTPHQRTPKILTTTGAITVANYTDTKAGAKGDFHHVLGAAIVEIQDGTFHLRHVNANSIGAFCDMDKAYYPDGTVRAAGPYKAIVFGDTHVKFIDKAVETATFARGGLVERLNPEILVFHDLLDNYAVNPHHFGKPFIGVIKRTSNADDVKKEVIEACEWLRTHTGHRQAMVIASNHNDFLSRWMNNQDWRFDSVNAEFYLETALHMVRTAKMGAAGAVIADPFSYWLSKLLADSKNIKGVGRSESLVISAIECSLHGDQGPNGSRGSRASLSKIGAKTIIGHSHTPGITEGCYQTGTSTPLSLEYTGPVGSWLQSHVSIDPMGKRHIHTLVNGRFWK